jgi:hypothetical protein
LWLFGQFAATGSSAASYQQAEEPVSQLINDFGPPVASPAAARQRAAMPLPAGLAEMTGVDLQDEIGPRWPKTRRAPTSACRTASSLEQQRPRLAIP